MYASLSRVSTIVGGLLLASCSSMQDAGTIMSPMHTLTPYKRLVLVSSDNPVIDSKVEQSLAALPDFAITQENNFGEFHLTIESKPARLYSQGNSPRLFGKLQMKETPLELEATYKITTAANTVLTEGDVSAISAGEKGVYPRLKTVNDLPADALDELADKITKEMTSYARAHEWSATVIGQLPDNHILISAGKEIGLKVNDKFITETQPISKMQLVTFEENPDTGFNRAVLKVNEGFMPSSGRRIILDK